MMGNTHREFTPEYKDEAVKLVITTGRPVSTVPRELRVKEATLGGWVNLFRASQDAGGGLDHEVVEGRIAAAAQRERRPKNEPGIPKKVWIGLISWAATSLMLALRWRYSGATNSADTDSGQLERKYPGEMQLSDRCWKAWALRKPFPSDTKSVSSADFRTRSKSVPLDGPD